MKKYYGKLSGIDIIVGDNYYINNEIWTLKEIKEQVYWFTKPIQQIGVEEKMMYYSEGFLFQKALDGTFKKFEYKISNDTVDAITYSLQNYITDYEPYEQPLRVYFNDKKKATTLIKGGKVVVVKTKKGEKYNRRIGFLEAYFELMSGMSKTQKNKYLDQVVKQ